MAKVIGVVGPSGVGKDSVMEAMAALRKDIQLVRRVVTRPAGAGGERSISATEDEFDDHIAQDQFQLWWAAHGLRYGVPRAAVASPDASIVLVNLSRGILDQARTAFDDFAVLSLRAKTETLAARLAARGRETSAEIVSRLERAGSLRPQGHDVIEIYNDGPLGETVQHALAALQPVRA
ncbi:MAG: phosphonate metabolism protein/1,5-bisphosphokinase (PRPP-forming) PhnN [Shimia sp.]|uniref:phosphonate metabolism protein/1,5-bisphosphokinase (PRPP-forming) PhnN n=1 Tax=Shimia sp. TaxID=1954381 RepID=UPI003B8BE342